jgi:hypothetical protein
LNVCRQRKKRKKEKKKKRKEKRKRRLQFIVQQTKACVVMFVRSTQSLSTHIPSPRLEICRGQDVSQSTTKLPRVVLLSSFLRHR